MKKYFKGSIKRYYSQEQYKRMAEIDPMAAMRNPQADKTSPFICVECGFVDSFCFKLKHKYIVTHDDNKLLLKPEPLRKIEAENIIDFLHENDGDINFYCSNCQGPVVARKIANEHCEKNKCLGCLICGKVTPLYEVEQRVFSCSDCYGGCLRCVGDRLCPNFFMRVYYGIQQTNEERQGKAGV